MSKAEEVAKRVIFECGLNHPTEETLSEVILGRGAHYQECPLTGKEGEIVSFEGKSIITINSNITTNSKKRFVAAHELGHYEMHRNLIPVINDTEYDLVNWYKAGPHETEANEFAAEFLMPTKLFQEECKGKIFGPEIIDHLADTFQVSKTATILRFVEKGNYPVCIIYCKDNLMKWWKKSADFRKFLRFSHNEPPPDGSVVSEFFELDINYYYDKRKQEVWKSVWFDVNPHESDTIVYEYCLYAKSYNYTLSIIWED